MVVLAAVDVPALSSLPMDVGCGLAGRFLSILRAVLFDLPSQSSVLTERTPTPRSHENNTP